MRSAFVIVAIAGLFQGAAAENITLSSKLSSDNKCQHQFRSVPEGSIELDKCQLADGVAVLYTCVGGNKLHFTLNLGGTDCEVKMGTYQAELTNGVCTPLKPLGFVSGVWNWSGGCDAKPEPPTLSKPTAAELRQFQGSANCSGEYTVLNMDQLDQCTPYLIPAPASVKVEQFNETVYSSYHYQGVQDCSGARTKVADFVVGECTNLPEFNYSMMRAWTSAPDPTSASCGAPGDCGYAYKACCAASKLKGSPCNCHLHNGTGTAGSSDCGFCGKAYVACCTAFNLGGHACTCDVNDKAATAIVV